MSPSRYLGRLALTLSLVACGDDGGSAANPGSSGGGNGQATGAGGGDGAGGPGGNVANGGGGNGAGGGGGSGGAPPADAITIVGAGFGSKASAGPVLFDDFEGGAIGQPVEGAAATVGAWHSGAGSDAPVYTDAVVRTGSRACLAPFDEAIYNASLAQNLDFSVAYLDYWTYVVPHDALPEGFSRNWKPFRLYGESDALQSGTTALSGNTAAIAYYQDSQAGADFTEWFGGYPVAEWFHIQYWLRLNDVGSQNGAFRVRIDTTEGGANGVTLRTSEVTMSELRIGHYWATDGVAEWPYDNSGADVFIDDVYFDTSWSRVEIANAADYEAATHREIQLVTSWSDTAVTFVPDPGALPAGPAWAFVIGEADTVLASQEIMLP